MYPRLQKAMGEALALVRHSKVGDATAVIRAALTGSDADVPAGNAIEKRVKAPAKITAQQPATKLNPTVSPYRQPRKTLSKRISGPAGQLKDGQRSFRARIYQHPERSLDYMLYLPKPLDTRSPSLLVMLHGCNQDPKDFAVGTQMNRYADEFNFIVAYPQQPKTANSLGCWNWFDPRHQKHGAGEPALLAGLTEELRTEFNVSKERIFVAGLSAGGAMAEILATEYSDIFAAAGIHSGLPYGAAHSVTSAFSAMRGSSRVERPREKPPSVNARRIVFHGSKDATVHPSNGAQIVKQARSRTAGLSDIRYDEDDNGAKVDRTDFKNSDGTTQAEYWVILGGGHAWSGGNREGSFTSPKGPNASREMLRFFSEGKKSAGRE